MSSAENAGASAYKFAWTFALRLSSLAVGAPANVSAGASKLKGRFHRPPPVMVSILAPFFKKTKVEKEDYCRVMIDEVTGETREIPCNRMRRGRMCVAGRLLPICEDGVYFEPKET